MHKIRTSENTDANTNFNTSSSALTTIKTQGNDESNNSTSDQSTASASNENNDIKRRKLSSLNKSKLPRKATEILKKWFLNNINHPYPNMEVKNTLSQLTGLTKKQIQNWYTNCRKVSVIIYHQFIIKILLAIFRTFERKNEDIHIK